MRWLIPFLAYPCVASVSASVSASESERVHLKFSIKRFDFVCEQERDIPLSEMVVLCDEGGAGKHLRMRAQVDPDKGGGAYMVKGWVEDVMPGEITVASAPRIMAMPGEESEVSSRTNNGVDVDFKVTVTPVK